MRLFIFSMLALLAMPATLSALGFKYNATDSLAHGVYRLVDTKAAKGDYAWFCPPDNYMVMEAKRRGYIIKGDCPGDYIHFMKKVVAVEGDSVTINANGVYVDGVLLALSKPIAKDGKGRPLLIYNLTNYRMGKDEYLMMTDFNEKSFDARYFGIVKSDNVQKIKQVITWKM